MIKSFHDEETRQVYKSGTTTKFPQSILPAAVRKLAALDSAVDVSDLRVPPGNRLEKLRGKREGQWSIRINDQYRICFEWLDGDSYEVEMVDYH